MKNAGKRIGTVAAVGLGALLTAYLAVHTLAQTSDSDKQGLTAIREAYENALNQDRIDLLKPYLADKLSATVATGHKVKNAGEFMAYWKTMKDLIGIGKGRQGSYHIELTPIDRFFVGDYAFSFGTTKEQLKTDQINSSGERESKSYDFNSIWYAVSTKESGDWKLLSGRIVVDPFRSVFSEKKVSSIIQLASTKLGPTEHP